MYLSSSSFLISLCDPLSPSPSSCFRDTRKSLLNYTELLVSELVVTSFIYTNLGPGSGPQVARQRSTLFHILTDYVWVHLLHGPPFSSLAPIQILLVVHTFFMDNASYLGFWSWHGIAPKKSHNLIQETSSILSLYKRPFSLMITNKLILFTWHALT